MFGAGAGGRRTRLPSARPLYRLHCLAVCVVGGSIRILGAHPARARPGSVRRGRFTVPSAWAGAFPCLANARSRASVGTSPDAINTRILWITLGTRAMARLSCAETKRSACQLSPEGRV